VLESIALALQLNDLGVGEEAVENRRRELEETRRACKSLASEPQIAPRPSCNEAPASGANTLIH
jgi:hypothetical protein